jgi:hypothetical protein
MSSSAFMVEWARDEAHAVETVVGAVDENGDRARYFVTGARRIDASEQQTTRCV